MARDLDALAELKSEIDRQIDPANEVRDDATAALRSIRRDQERVRERILGSLERVKRSLDSPGSDPVVTLRNDRYVIGVRRDRMGELRGVIHGRSGSGVSVYFEPAHVVPLNNELAELRSAEDEEIRRILTLLTAAIRARLGELRQNERILAELDAFYACGKLSRDLQAVPGQLSEDGSVVIRKGRHPLLEMSHAEIARRSGSRTRVTVPLDLTLGGDSARILVITGPNTGGKTVALKTVGLFVLMHQAGLHVPAAEGTRFPILRDVFADIGDEQSIEASLSTFSSHMRNVIEVLKEADDKTLVLLDELGVGTDPDEGIALAKAILRELARAGAPTIVTTHYSSLKIFAHDEPGMENASLEFDRERLSPTYRFLQGVPGSSEALSIATRLGFPSHLVEEARDSLGPDRGAAENFLRDLQERLKKLEIDEALLAEERAGVRDSQRKVEERLARAREERAAVKREALAEARALIEGARSQLAEILETARGDAAGKGGDRARTRLGELSRTLEGEEDRAREAAREPSRPARPEEIEEGARVAIPKMGWNGVVIGPVGSNGRVPVQVGSLRVEVPVSSLELREAARAVNGSSPRKAATPPREAHSPSLGFPGGSGSTRAASPESASRPVAFVPPEMDVKTEIDLRGRTVEEAVSEIDRAIDGLVIAGGSFVRIIHGKGTGALRVAIGEHLKNDARIASFRLGDPAEGGAGVTIAVLK
jgi:DNA mismatch repair protein MutS2